MGIFVKENKSPDMLKWFKFILVLIVVAMKSNLHNLISARIARQLQAESFNELVGNKAATDKVSFEWVILHTQFRSCKRNQNVRLNSIASGVSFFDMPAGRNVDGDNWLGCSFDGLLRDNNELLNQQRMNRKRINLNDRIERWSNRARETESKDTIDNQVAILDMLLQIIDEWNAECIHLSDKSIKKRVVRPLWVVNDRTVAKQKQVSGSNKSIAAIVARTSTNKN